MTEPSTIQYVCIHGHFYQPPRENPWLEAIEREESAAPYHNWNERIDHECYRANTAARLVDDRNRILDLYDNYRSLSFNFGATLLTWMEKHDPRTYRAIIEADRESRRRLNGHGNAIAQIYTHIIMPLANRQEKQTHVRWGIRDFEHRFGRRPEGMWLAETAVDRETLSVLAEEGIRFTVLSPYQAHRMRIIDPDSAWEETPDGTIPTGRAYRYDCGDGKFIHIFFYDKSIAKGIAFEGLLGHSSRLVAQIRSAYEYRRAAGSEPWLVHTATDGESYGHHFKFGDMALGAAFRELEKDPDTRIVNYGYFLSAFPVVAEVEIIENTAWSCAHGVDRWRADCGCRIGGPDRHQKWRAPLRAAMNDLRDKLFEHYMREMGRMAPDPVETQNAYIEVLLDQERALPFFRQHAPGSTEEGIHRFYKLLEMQRYALFMFTSCGWFFDDVAGLETVLILRYAARALQLAEQTGAPSFEPSFLKILAEAPGNDPEFPDGAIVYIKKARPQKLDEGKIVAGYAVRALSGIGENRFSVYRFDIIPVREDDLGVNPVPCMVGRVRVKDNRTLEEREFIYGVIHFGALDFRCSVKPCVDNAAYDSLLTSMEGAAEAQSVVGMVRIMDEVFGSSLFFGLQDMLGDMKSSVALEISERTMATYVGFQRHLYQTYRPVLASLRQMGIEIPDDLHLAVKRVLREDVDRIITDLFAHEEQNGTPEREWDATDFFYRAHMGRLHAILEDARSWETVVQPSSEVADEIGTAMMDTLDSLRRVLSHRTAGKFYRLIGLCRELGIKPQAWMQQTRYREMIETLLKKPDLTTRFPKLPEFLAVLDDFLGCRFARLIETMQQSRAVETVPRKDPPRVVQPGRYRNENRN